MEQISAFIGGIGGYDAGKVNRLTKERFAPSMKENFIPADQIHRLREQSWNLYRNNTHARKIVRTIETKVIGRGINPESQATNADGSPHAKFRARAKKLWNDIQGGFDYRGMPGYGGIDFVSLQKSALRAVILSGEALAQPRYIDGKEQRKRSLPVALTCQLIDSNRLAENIDIRYSNVLGSNEIYRGIELNGDGRRVAYHLLNTPITYNFPTALETERIPADKIIHLFTEEDIDQLRGVPWFAPAIMRQRDTSDYEYNELKASALAACVALWYRRPSGSNQTLGLNGSSDSDATDADGNAITRLQPGLIMNLGKDGEAGGFNPARPSTNVEAFVQYLLRATAAGFPGVKASTLTGDYRNSSFSSERSADNDAWPELVGLQDWFAISFNQPLYDVLIDTAVTDGYFDGIVTPEEYNSRRADFLRCAWQGPLGLSITPKDDAMAASLRIKTGISSVQMECAKVNVDYRDMLKDIGAYCSEAEAAGVPKEVVFATLGVTNSLEIQSELAPEQPQGAASNGKQASNAA